MTKVESGEWEPVLKIAQTTTLGFSSAYWSNDDLLNAASPLTEEAGDFAAPVEVPRARPRKSAAAKQGDQYDSPPPFQAATNVAAVASVSSWRAPKRQP